MESKPNLSQYFGGSEPPPAAQFFDEIGTSPSAMNQSICLDGTDGSQIAIPVSQNLGPITTQTIDQEIIPPNIIPTVSGSTVIPAVHLPDPSTFFDTLDSDSQIGSSQSGILSSAVLTEVMEPSNIKNVPEDMEEDRRRNAWIPIEDTKKILQKVQSSPKGTFFPDRESLTMPGLVLDEELPDALQEAAVKFLGVSTASRRKMLRADRVSQDEAGLRELMHTGHLRAAINLTGKLISAAGQGVGRMHKPTKNTPRSLQLWLTRFAVMCRLKIVEPLLKEAEPFGDLSKPDMFYQFYPDLYGNRTGSMVPFALRMLIAELQGHAGKPEASMDKLYIILDTVQQMIANLQNGKSEDGTSTISAKDKEESLKLWSGRQTRIMHSILNCTIFLKDYRLTVKILTSLRDQAETPQQKRSLCSALCRVSLLAGDVDAAMRYSTSAIEVRNIITPTPDLREYLDLGLIDIALGKYVDAFNNFVKAGEQEPSNVMVASNLAVCLLYMGRLKAAIAMLQKAVHADPTRALNGYLLTNLCTLYELESTQTKERKLNLLRMLCKYKSDTIPNVLECLKLT